MEALFVLSILLSIMFIIFAIVVLCLEYNHPESVFMSIGVIVLGGLLIASSAINMDRLTSTKEHQEKQFKRSMNQYEDDFTKEEMIEMIKDE